jgi:hypothetical protein
MLKAVSNNGKILDVPKMWQNERLQPKKKKMTTNVVE